MVQSSSTIALSGDLRSPTSGPPPLVQGGPGWSKVVQGGPVEVHSAPSLPAGRQNGALSEAGSGIEPRRAQTVRSGMRRRSQRVSRGGAAHPQAGGQWTRLDHPSLVQGGPGWSRVVQAARCGRGPAHHPGAVRNRRTGRFRVDWPSMGRCGMHAARTQLGGPPPGSLKCEYFKVLTIQCARPRPATDRADPLARASRRRRPRLSMFQSRRRLKRALTPPVHAHGVQLPARRGSHRRPCSPCCSCASPSLRRR